MLFFAEWKLQDMGLMLGLGLVWSQTAFAFPPFPRFLSTNCFKFLMDLNIQEKKMAYVAQRIYRQ